MKSYAPKTMHLKFKKIISHSKLYISEVTGVLLLVLGIYFLKGEGKELKGVGQYISSGNSTWIVAGIIIAVIYIFLQSMMYVASFKAVGLKVSIWESAILFLKRNLISIFLPGGGITSLAFFTKEIQKETNEESKTRIHLASSIYGFTGIVSIILISIPVLIYLSVTGASWGNANQAAIILIFFVLLIAYLGISFAKKGWIYRKVHRFFPQINLEFRKQNNFKFQFFIVNVYAVLIDLAGILHLYIAMRVIGADASWMIALIGYVIATLLLVISPFLRGIGAIEFSLTLILRHYGFSISEALAITLIYRLFEFWIPIALGIVSFVVRKGNMLLRVAPALLLFVLGIVNIISVLTPALHYRLKLLRELVPAETIHMSNYMVFILGLFSIITSGFLFRGLKNAWRFAILLCILSLIGNITKAIDYEEATVALITLLVLWFTRKEYYIKHNKQLQRFGISTALIILVGVLIYGIIGFYFLDKRHFNIDFSLIQSIKHTFLNFILFDVDDLKPLTHFGAAFLNSIRFSGIVSICLLFYAIIKPYFIKVDQDKDEVLKAEEIIEKFGSSPVDYFKKSEDKLFYFGVKAEGLISYRVSGSFAIVLDEPVCADDDKKLILIEEFEEFCNESGLKSAYYRVEENSLKLFTTIRKKSLVIGQEAIIDLQRFTLEGKDRRSMRNGLNNMERKGLKTVIHQPPIKDGLLQQLKFVSDDWLKTTNREELVFTQGMFDWNKLKNQTIITIENNDELVYGFLNIIPDYAPDEATYDLIRKIADAPSGVIDALLIALIHYCKSENIKYLNLGLAPLSGIDQASGLPEKTLKFAYEKLQQFSHYRGLRDFKEKFSPEWTNKYLIYENHYDLISLPNALNKVMKP